MGFSSEASNSVYRDLSAKEVALAEQFEKVGVPVLAQIIKTQDSVLQTLVNLR